MRSRILILATHCALLWSLCSHAAVLTTPLTETRPAVQTLSGGRFGDVTVYRPAGRATSVVLFISGDGGWNLGVVGMAQHLADQGAIVVGIDIRKYRKILNAQSFSSCQNYAGDFEALSHSIQQQLQLEDYRLPLLAGYSSGATLAYATMVQAPKGTFAGVISLGFCPDLDLVNKPCVGDGLEYDFQYTGKPAGSAANVSTRIKGLVYRAAPHSPTPWIVLQGDADQVCPAAATQAFVASTGAGELVALPKVGHGYGAGKNWLPQFLDAHQRLVAVATKRTASVTDVSDLPLVEVPATATADGPEPRRFAVLLTGDGGWAGLDQDVAAALAARGIPVVGLNTLKYFWHAREPEAAAKDLDRIVSSYAAHWHTREVLLIGYSFGADVLPFLYNRLSAEQHARVRSVSLIGLSSSATFEFHLSEWLPGADGSEHKTAPEIAAMNGTPVLCIYGKEEKDSPCPTLHRPGVETTALEGGHHLGGDYGAIAQQIVAFAEP